MNYFESIIGYEGIKYELNRIIDCLNNQEKYNKLGVVRPDNLLMYGPPGLGKTITAMAFINALNRNKYVISKTKDSREFRTYLRDTIIEASNNTPSVILFDDLEKYSNDTHYSYNTDEFIVIQSLMNEYKDKDIYYVATVNDFESLPGSLLRSGRFGKRIAFFCPSLDESTKIIEYYLKDKKVCNDVDFNIIAKMLKGKTCSDLEIVINDAGIYAGFDNRDCISMDDITKAILRLFYNVPASFESRSKKQMELISFHEAGHVIVQEYLEPGGTNFVSVKNFISDKLGLANMNYSEDYSVDIKHVEKNILCLLGGRAAIEIVFGKMDVLAEDDLKRAFSIAEKLADDLCVSGFKANSYNATYQLMNKLMNKYYQKAKRIVKKNKSKLFKIAYALIDKKYLSNEEIKMIINNKKGEKNI